MSLNDPNWGRGGSRGPQGPGGGNQGPPDLDELWRSFNRRLAGPVVGRTHTRGLAGLCGGGRRGGGGDEPPPPPSGRMLGGGAGLLVLLFAGIWLASGFYIVVEGQRGVGLHFGKVYAEAQAGPR